MHLGVKSNRVNALLSDFEDANDRDGRQEMHNHSACLSPLKRNWPIMNTRDIGSRLHEIS